MYNNSKQQRKEIKELLKESKLEHLQNQINMIEGRGLPINKINPQQSKAFLKLIDAVCNYLKPSVTRVGQP